MRKSFTVIRRKFKSFKNTFEISENLMRHMSSDFRVHILTKLSTYPTYSDGGSDKNLIETLSGYEQSLRDFSYVDRILGIQLPIHNYTTWSHFCTDKTNSIRL